jgi:hypothetical protein
LITLTLKRNAARLCALSTHVALQSCPVTEEGRIRNLLLEEILAPKNKYIQTSRAMMVCLKPEETPMAFLRGYTYSF